MQLLEVRVDTGTAVRAIFFALLAPSTAKIVMFAYQSSTIIALGLVSSFRRYVFRRGKGIGLIASLNCVYRLHEYA